MNILIGFKKKKNTKRPECGERLSKGKNGRNQAEGVISAQIIYSKALEVRVRFWILFSA